jgi:transcriptional regulator with XRE-family HTH domain
MASQQTHQYRDEDLTFPALIQRVADDKGWNQSDLARAIGVQIGTVSTWFNGTRLPGGPNLRKLAEGTGVPEGVWAASVGRKVPAPLDGEHEAYIVELWRRLSADEQRFFTKALEANARDDGAAKS